MYSLTDENDCETEEERAELKKHKQCAARVLPLIKRHHLLLVTLLLMNATANEALPIFLDKIVSEAVAIILSVTLLLIFAEIIPSAVFTGPAQLKIAAAFVGIVWVFVGLFFPIGYVRNRVRIRVRIRIRIRIRLGHRVWVCVGLFFPIGYNRKSCASCLPYPCTPCVCLLWCLCLVLLYSVM